jgi:hypothetical protein
MRISHLHCFLLVALCGSLLVTETAGQTDTKEVLVGSRLSSGFDMGVNSSENRTNWLTAAEGYCRMSYPANQAWGAVFITVGSPKQPPRPFRDFSAYRILSIEMKGEAGTRIIEVGIKSNSQPDDGSETKLSVNLTPDWKAYEFPLEKFGGTDISRLYVVAEFVFSGSDRQTVYVRNIRYLKRSVR